LTPPGGRRTVRDMAEVAAISTSTPAADAPAGIEIPDFDIVPRKGLILVAIVFAGLIVAIAANRLWPLEFLHVAFGGAWTVLDLFLGFVLGPIMGGMPPAARVAFTTRLMPKMLLIMPTVVTVALASGWQLGVYLGTVSSDHPNHGWTVASFIVVGVMAILALGLLEPANVAVLVELKKRRPNPVVIERLMKRFIYSAGVIGLMQIATLVIMTKLASG
jgi:MFS family permease